MPENNALVLEVIENNSRLNISLYRKSEINSTLRHYNQQSLHSKEISKISRGITSILNKATKSETEQSRLYEELKKSGQLLWEYLLTKNVRQRLRDAESVNLTVFIGEELIGIPWELLYTGEEFLCLKFNMGRLVRTEEKLTSCQYRDFSSKPRMLILVNPTKDLQSAYLEGVHIKNRFDKIRNQITIDFKSTYIDKFYVKKNIRDYDIIHFAGHCEYNPDNPEESGWVLADGKFTAKDMLMMSDSFNVPSLIFSNACHSAHADSGKLDLKFQEKTYSIASAFLFSGVRHYIGTIWKIPDTSSLIFAREFYDCLLQGAQVGECIRAARLKLTQDSNCGSLLWANYILYGDPDFSIFRQKEDTGRPRNRTSAVILKKPVIATLAILFFGLSAVFICRFLPTLSPNAYCQFLRSKGLFTGGKNNHAIELAKQIINKDQSFLQAYAILAGSYERLGDRQSALKTYFDYAIAAERKNNYHHLSAAYTSIGWVYQLKGDYGKAMEFYSKAIELSSKCNDKLNAAIAIRKLALWHMDKEDYNKALELLLKSSEMNRARQSRQEHKYNLACDYFDIGLVFVNKNDFPAAREFYLKSKILFERLNSQGELSDYYFNLGEIYLFEKQYIRALNCYLAGLKIDQAMDNRPNIASDYTMIGELYAETGNFDDAEKYFNMSIRLCQDMDARMEKASAFYSLGLLYKQANRKNKARENLRFAQEIYSVVDTPDYMNVKKELLSLD